MQVIMQVVAIDQNINTYPNIYIEVVRSVITLQV